MSRVTSECSIAHVHVFGHPTRPLDLPAAPGDAQVFNAHNFCRMLSRARVPFTYYGLDGSAVPPGGAVAWLGRTRCRRWQYGSAWHREYTRRLQAAFAARVDPALAPQLVVSLYGAAQMDVDCGRWPVVEAMVGYDHCWAPYRVFPSYAHQHVIYANPAPHVQDRKWFDTVIPHFVDPADYWISPEREDYALFLGRDAPDKGVTIAREVCAHAGIPFRAVHGGVAGAAKTDLIARAQVVLMPTVYVEPFGYVAIEAQMCGVPVVTTDWGAFAETVEHGRSGFRCRTLAEFVAAVRLAPGLSPEAIRRRAVRLYSVRAVTSLYLSYLEFVWNVHEHGGYYAPQAWRRSGLGTRIGLRRPRTVEAHDAEQTTQG
jgi:glycosyltransferase involved in cell wall biosynthesis